jgi:hypothetical protein
MANLILSVMCAFAEFERSLIRERQREGIALAKQRGAYKGRKKILTPERAAELVQRGQRGTTSAPCPRLRHQQRDRLPVPPARKAGMSRPAGTVVMPSPNTALALLVVTDGHSSWRIRAWPMSPKTAGSS